jgi:putative membrane protein
MVRNRKLSNTKVRNGFIEIEPIHVIQNITNNNYYEFNFRGSVIPKILFPTIIGLLWATFWTYFYITYDHNAIALSPILITILNGIVGMLLVFRTNTAYDRYWEARKLWGNTFSNIRILTRYYISNTKTSEELPRKNGIKLLYAFSVSLKHHLRMEYGLDYNDLRGLIEFDESFDKSPNIGNVPLEVIFHLSKFISDQFKLGLVDVGIMNQMFTCLNNLTNILSDCERIRDSPVPVAYSIHLKQILVLYLLLLPFQLVSTCRWTTVGIVAVACFILLGVEAIGHEIENPFGYDLNDLKMDRFVKTLKEDLIQVSSPDIFN